ncbi:MAG TPA: hypothetical protein DGG95_07175 [Cytophagales bacterium]|jgi:hypothetical protein|nr:hypothetical protein [Cytophagales bacterium]
MTNHLKKYAFAYSSLVIVAIWISTPFILIKFVSTDFMKLGQVGDLFGTLNALFSGITIAGLIITIIKQQEEIETSRKEFKEQKELLQRHHDEQKDQARKLFDEQKEQIQTNFNEEKERLQKQIIIQKLERFDNTFFKMIDLHNKIIDNLERKRNEFEAFCNSKYNLIWHVNDIKELEEEFQKRIRPSADIVFGHYVQNLIEILRMICKKRTEEGRSKYLNILFAQFTQYERQFLFYYFNIYPPEKFELFKYKLFDAVRGEFSHNPNHLNLFA